MPSDTPPAAGAAASCPDCGYSLVAVGPTRPDCFWCIRPSCLSHLVWRYPFIVAPVPRVGEGGTPTIRCQTCGHDTTDDGPTPLSHGETACPMCYHVVGGLSDGERTGPETRAPGCYCGTCYSCRMRIAAHRAPEEAAVPTTWTGSWNNWIAPFHACPHCGASLNWGQHEDVFDRPVLGASCSCGVHFGASLTWQSPAAPAVAVPGEAKSMSENDLGKTATGQLESRSTRDATGGCSCAAWQENIGKVNAPLLVAAARNPHHPGYDGEVFRYCPWCGTGLSPLQQREGETPPTGLTLAEQEELSAFANEHGNFWLAELWRALSTERAARREAELRLGEAAREINCAGPVAHRIRTLKAEHEVALATAARHRDALREAAEKVCMSEQPGFNPYLSTVYAGAIAALRAALRGEA